jgi:hypothetical protein
MLPLLVPCGFDLILLLLAGDLLLQSLATRVVCVCFGGGFFVLVLGVAFFVTVLAAMAAAILDEEWGGDGARPVDGANREVSGSSRFSLGFLNMIVVTDGSC